MSDKTVAFSQELVAAGFRYVIANILAEDMGTIDLMNKHLLPAFS